MPVLIEQKQLDSAPQCVQQPAKQTENDCRGGKGPSILRTESMTPIDRQTGEKYRHKQDNPVIKTFMKRRIVKDRDIVTRNFRPRILGNLFYVGRSAPKRLPKGEGKRQEIARRVIGQMSPNAAEVLVVGMTGLESAEIAVYPVEREP